MLSGLVEQDRLFLAARAGGGVERTSVTAIAAPSSSSPVSA